ncbi:hypothetical protein JCM3774_002683 [Rhodotorula dairenensis]
MNTSDPRDPAASSALSDGAAVSLGSSSLASRRSAPHSFHRTLQEEALARILCAEPDYSRCTERLLLEDTRVKEADAAVRQQLAVVQAAAATVTSLTDRVPANSSSMRHALHQRVELDAKPNVDPSGPAWRLLSEYERLYVAPYRVCEYPTVDCWATSVPCFPIGREECLDTTAEELLKPGSLLQGLFRDYDDDTDYDFTSEGISAARAYLAEIVEPFDSSETTADLLEFRAPLPPTMHADARLWFTQLLNFAPGYDDPFYEGCDDYDPWTELPAPCVLYTAIGPSQAKGPGCLDVQAGDRIMVVNPEIRTNGLVEAYHLMPANEKSLMHGLVSYAGCLVEADDPEITSANRAEATKAPSLGSKPAFCSERELAPTRFVDGRKGYTAFRRAVQDIVAVVASRAIRGTCEHAHRTEVLMAEMIQYREDEDQRIAELESLHTNYTACVFAANLARERLAAIEPPYFDAIRWLVILSRSPA